MAVDKFLQHIAAPDLEDDKCTEKGQAIALHLHDHTHRITLDPLAVFGIVLSASIHDADHHGISSAQLIKEEEQMGTMH